MKSTQATTYRTLNAELGSINNKLEDLRTQAATGKKINRPSDDPAAIRPVLSARTQIRASERFISSMSTSLDRLDNQDTYLDQVENLLVSAKETTINAINGAMSDADLDTLADKIGYIKTEMMSVANSQVGGQYIFAGFQEDTAPFTADGDQISYNGDSNVKRLETAPGEYVETNLNGAELFMGMSDKDGDGVLEQTGINMFDLLTDLERAIRGESGQVYSGDTALPTGEIGYVDAAGGDYTPIALNDSGAPLLDMNGDAVPMTFNGEPISLQPVVGIAGQQLTIGEYNTQFPPGVANDYNGSPLTATALQQPMYLYNDGTTPVDFNVNGDPVLPFGDGSALAVSGLSAGTVPAIGLPAVASVTGTAMSGPTVGGGDLTIGGENIAASASATELATNIEAAATAAGLSVTATAANSTSGADLNTWSDVAVGDSFSLAVEGVSLFANDVAGVTAADVDTAITTNLAALTTAGVSVSGTAAGGDLMFTKADGSNLDVEQTVAGGATGFTSIATDGTPTTYYGAVTIDSGAEFNIGGNAISLQSGGAPLQMAEVPGLEEMLTTLETSADSARSARGRMGNNAQRIETSKSHMEGVLVDLAQILSRYEDADLVDVITEITQTETALEAALNVTGRVSQLSIFDYLR